MQKLGPGLAVGGIVLLIAVLLVFFVGVPVIINNKVTDETQLKNNSETWVKWRDVEVPVSLSFYIFDIQNPDADLRNGERFEVEERGPYVYIEKRQKKILDINEEDDTVTYEETIHYFFDQESSNGLETDTVNIINAPFIIVSTILTKALGGIANVFIEILKAQGESMVRQNVTVGEMIFYGFDTQIYTPIVSLSPGGPPEEFADNSFSFYKGKNGSTDGIFTIKTGVKDYKTFGNIVTYNGKKELDWWTDPLAPSDQQYCNKINGSDGSIFPPFVKKDRTMRIFNTDICRSLYLTFNSEGDYKGIKSYKFTIPKEMLENPSTNLDNKCFCPAPGRGLASHCAGGVIRIFPCKNGAPVVSSNPHYLDADEHFVTDSPGIKQNREAHQTVIEVEPKSGQLLQALKRVQINVELQPFTGIAAFRDVPGPSYIVPVFWAEEHAALSDEDVEELKDKLIKPLKTLETVKWVVIGLTIALSIGGIALTMYRRKKNAS